MERGGKRVRERKKEREGAEKVCFQEIFVFKSKLKNNRCRFFRAELMKKKGRGKERERRRVQECESERKKERQMRGGKSVFL